MTRDLLLRELESLAEAAELPDGEPCRVLDLHQAQLCAARHETSLLEVEIFALEQGISPKRYMRNFKAWDIKRQLLLLKGAVALVGLGGLGGGLLELLARAGVGRILAADGDVFEQSNCNRQLLCTMDTLGRPKSQAAEARVQQINPGVICQCRHDVLDQASMLQLIRDAGEGTIVLDALGGLDSRPALWRAAREAGRPMVTAAVAGGSGCMGSFFPGEAGPELLFAPASSQGSAAEDVLGTQGPGVHLAACLQAQEAIRLLQQPETQEGRVLFFDLNDLTFERVRL